MRVMATAFITYIVSTITLLAQGDSPLEKGVGWSLAGAGGLVVFTWALWHRFVAVSDRESTGKDKLIEKGDIENAVLRKENSELRTQITELLRNHHGNQS